MKHFTLLCAVTGESSGRSDSLKIEGATAADSGHARTSAAGARVRGARTSGRGYKSCRKPVADAGLVEWGVSSARDRAKLGMRPTPLEELGAVAPGTRPAKVV